MDACLRRHDRRKLIRHKWPTRLASTDLESDHLFWLASPSGVIKGIIRLILRDRIMISGRETI
jgi:hypothetical protein